MSQTDLHTHDAILTTHVVDIARGIPGANVAIELFRLHAGQRTLVTRAVTNDQGRCAAPLLSAPTAEPGTYLLEFDTGGYHGVAAPFARIPVEFNIADNRGHYHVPLILAPGGYSTYRGAPPSRAPDDGGLWAGVSAAPATLPAVSMSVPPGIGGPGLTLHAIDVARGRGAACLNVDLYRCHSDIAPSQWLGTSPVNSEGRTDHWLVEAGQLQIGDYEMVLAAGNYFSQLGFGVGPMPFLEQIRIRIRVADTSQHHHIPILLSPWGYTCYRGN